MKYFTLYRTYIKLRIEQSMYSTDSSIQWLRFVIPLLVRCIRHSRNDLRRWRVIRIIGPADFSQIERSCVWPGSPGLESEGGIFNDDLKWDQIMYITH